MNVLLRVFWHVIRHTQVPLNELKLTKVTVAGNLKSLQRFFEAIALEMEVKCQVSLFKIGS